MHKVLVLGGSGLVGKAIINELNKIPEFQVYETYFKGSLHLNENRSFRLDVENSNNIYDLLNAIKPESVISCLRGDYDKQLLIHTKIAEFLKKSGGNLYFCSTTNVFDNDLTRPHYEEDPPDSCTDYGKYKIECEKKITEILQEKACILRLPQIWGKTAPRMNALLKALQKNEKILVYPNLILSTYTDIAIAKKVSYILSNNLKGIFHLVTDDVINHKTFYNELIKGLGFNNAEFEEDYEEKGYFAILSNRNNEFPEHLKLTNNFVINYLLC